MRRALSLAVTALVACNAPSTTEPPPKPAVVVAAAPKPVDPKAEAAADLETMRALAKAEPDQAYPQADAVVALERDDVSLGADGTVVEHHKSIVKLLDDQRGKQKFADVHVQFDTKRQELTIQQARTVNADGEPHAASPDELTDIVPERLADATIYSDVRERVVSLPAVDRGSVVELEYTRTTHPSPDAAMGGELLLGQWDPVLERVVTITVAAGAAPQVEVVGADVKPTESTTAAGHTWTYRLTGLPDRHPERDSLPDPGVLPRLVYGFRPTWAQVLEPLAERFLKAAAPTPALKVEADRIVGAAKSDGEKAAKLFAFVAHDVRSVDLPLGWGGYEPHPPGVVLKNGYADNRDKVALLLALAATQGVEGRPVMVRTGRVPVLSSVPTVAQFDHVIAKLTIGGKDVWLDPSDQYGQYGVVFEGQDNFVLPLQQGGSELGRRSSMESTSSVSRITTTLALAANGDLDAKYSYELTGWYADRAVEQLRPLAGERLAQYFDMAASEVSASALDKGHELSDPMAVVGPLKLSHHVSVAGYSVAQQGFRVVELPSVSLGVASDLPSVGLAERKSALYAGVPRVEQSDVSLQVPAGWKVAYVPPKLEGTADGVHFVAGCTATGQRVTCHREFTFDKLVLSPDEYPAYREVLTKLLAYERRIVVLTKG